MFTTTPTSFRSTWLAMMPLMGLLALASTAEAQTNLVYSVQIKSASQNLKGLVVITAPAINPNDHAQGPHNCDFLITTTMDLRSSFAVGTLVYATNQRYFGTHSLINNSLNLETAYGTAQKNGTVLFQSQASNSRLSFTNPTAGTNPNFFQVQPVNFGTGLKQIVSGSANLTVSKDGKTITGSVSLGGTSDALIYPSPTYFYNATITGTLSGTTTDVIHFN